MGFPDISRMKKKAPGSVTISVPDTQKPVYTVKNYTPEKVIVDHISMTEKEAQTAGYTYRKKSRNRLKITHYHCSETGTLIIPSMIGGMIVNEIGMNAFKGCKSTELHVPGTIRKFGESPFNSSSVKRVLLGEGITETSRFCFVSCTELTDVSLPTTMQHLAVSTFNNCSSLETIHIPYACHIIDDCAFYRTGLKEIYAEDPDHSLRNGRAFRYSRLEELYSAIFPSENCLLMVCKNDGVKYDTKSPQLDNGVDLKISTERLVICKNALSNDGHPIAKRIDLSGSRCIRFNFANEDRGYHINEKTELIMPEGYDDRYYPSFFNVVHADGTPLPDYLRTDISDDGRVMTIESLPYGIPKNYLDTGNAEELIFKGHIGPVHDYAIKGHNLRRVYFEKGLPFITGKVFGLSNSLHEFSWTATHDDHPDNSPYGYSKGDTLSVFLPPTELVGWYIHRILNNSLALKQNDIPLVDEPGWKRIYKRSIFDRSVYMKVFSSKFIDLRAFGVWNGPYRIKVHQKILIALDAIRSSDHYFREDKEVYRKYLLSHKRYARIVCDRLPEKWHEYGDLLDEIMKSEGLQ